MMRVINRPENFVFNHMTYNEEHLSYLILHPVALHINLQQLHFTSLQQLHLYDKFLKQIVHTQYLHIHVHSNFEYM